MSQKHHPPKRRRRNTALPPMTKYPRRQRYGRQSRHFNNRQKDFIWGGE